MWSTPSSIARRRTASAAPRSRGGPNTPGPASCIAPNQIRRTSWSPSFAVWFRGHALRVRYGRLSHKKGTHRGTRTTTLRGAPLGADGLPEDAARARHAAGRRLLTQSEPGFEQRAGVEAHRGQVAAELEADEAVRRGCARPEPERPKRPRDRRRFGAQWRRWELNPRPRSSKDGVYERSRRSGSRPEVASPAGLLGTSLLKISPVWRRRAAPGESAF